MTTLISWLGVDSRSPSSIYLASDSRISWGNIQGWDTGRKLFASKTMPEIFGYCGDVTFPIQVLGQIVEQIDNGLLFSENEGFEGKLKKIHALILKSYTGLPRAQQRYFEILYVSRSNSRMQSDFKISQIFLNSQKEVIVRLLDIPNKSDLIIRSGSGKQALKRWYNKWVEPKLKDPNGITKTSRNIFSAFCDSLLSKDDHLSGGAPQLVGLYRVGAAKNFGIIYEGKRYFNGLEVESNTQLDGVEWRNVLFERYDAEYMDLLKGAQPQPRPKFIKN